MPLNRFSKLDPEKKQEILRVVADEFAEHGYENASLNRIIAKSGVSKGAMYYYFEDKDDLYRTALDHWAGSIFEQMRPRSQAETPEDYWQEWVAVYRRSILHFLERPSHAAILWQSIRNRASGISHPALTEVAVRLRQWLRDRLRRGQQIGAVRTDLPESLLLDASFAMLEGFDRWLAEQWGATVRDRIDELATLVAGLLRRIAEAEKE